MLQKIFLILLLMDLYGCATTCERSEGCDPFNRIIKNNLSKMEFFNEKKVTKSLINFHDTYRKEHDYLNDWPPKLGLALSGGGTRAASFGIGVMKALNETKHPNEKTILDNVNIISSVSGGSYANYWYFSQLFYKDKLSNPEIKKTLRSKKIDNSFDLFKTWDNTESNLANPNDYRFQRHLEESSMIMAFTHKSSFWNDFRVKAQYGAQIGFQALWTPFYWLANGLFDWEVNLTPFFYFYKDGLDRTYGFVPLDYTLENYANGHPAFFGVGNLDAEPIILSDMSSFLDKNKRKLPYFIINTTAGYGYSGHDTRLPMESSVFEFTPWGCHSDLLNIHADRECPLKDFHLEWNRSNGFMQLDLARIVAISGAAVDGQASTVDVSGRETESYKILGKPILEIALDTLNFNLGYTLQNQDTSEQDRFFHKLLPWPLYVIDDNFRRDKISSIHLSDGGHSENLGILPLIRRKTKCIIAVDAEHDPNSTFESAKRLKVTLERHGYSIDPIQPESESIDSAVSTPHPIDVHDVKSTLSHAVSLWQVRGEENGTSLEKPIKIIYIKLAAPSKYKSDNNSLNELPYSVVSYLKENPDFPHESTMDIFYSAEQFRAYRDLGYAIANSYFSQNKLSCPDT